MGCDLFRLKTFSQKAGGEWWCADNFENVYKKNRSKSYSHSPWSTAYILYIAPHSFKVAVTVAIAVVCQTKQLGIAPLSSWHSSEKCKPLFSKTRRLHHINCTISATAQGRDGQRRLWVWSLGPKSLELLFVSHWEKVHGGLDHTLKKLEGKLICHCEWLGCGIWWGEKVHLSTNGWVVEQQQVLVALASSEALMLRHLEWMICDYSRETVRTGIHIGGSGIGAYQIFRRQYPHQKKEKTIEQNYIVRQWAFLSLLEVGDWNCQIAAAVGVLCRHPNKWKAKMTTTEKVIDPSAWPLSHPWNWQVRTWPPFPTRLHVFELVSLLWRWRSQLPIWVIGIWLCVVRPHRWHHQAHFQVCGARSRYVYTCATALQWLQAPTHKFHMATWQFVLVRSAL